MSRKLSILFGVVAVVIFATGTAVAQKKRKAPPKAFQEKYFDAETAYRMGELDKAEKLFKQAGKLYKAAGVYRGLAAVYVDRAETSKKPEVRSKAYEQCLSAAFEAIKMNPKSSRVGELKALHQDCRKGLGRSPYLGKIPRGQGVLAISSNRLSARVKINGIFSGATPLKPKAVNVGRAVIMVSKTGLGTKSLVVDILEGVVTDVRVTFDGKR